MDWIRGEARLVGKRRVDVTNGQRQTLDAKDIVVATGSAPRSLPGIEIDHRRILTSDDAIGLREVPASIAILGCGAVGVEFASIFRRFGSDVTLIELLPRLVPLEDEAVSGELERAFRKQGITVRTGTKVTSATAHADSVTLDAVGPDGQADDRLQVACVLVAVGRGPVTRGLGATDVGLGLDAGGFVVVDDQYRTSVSGISAVGDVITLGWPGHPQLAHLSSAEGIRLAERIAGRETRPLNYDQVPSCVYCDPEIGSVGLTEAEAVRRGYDVRVGVFPFGVLGRAKIAGETDGLVKIVSEKTYDELLGIHMIGPRATELVAEATIALRLECTTQELARTIHAHPTLSEAIAEAAHASHGTAIHA